MSRFQLRLAPSADEDLDRIESYITEELSNPDAAKKVVREIMDEYEKLADFPNMGVDITPMIGIVTGFRMLVCGHYNVFYKEDGEYVSIYRVLYYRRDFISVLFGG